MSPSRLHVVLSAVRSAFRPAPLLALLWPEADDESARTRSGTRSYGLRQTLGETAFVSRGEGYIGLELGAVRCDALELRRLLAGHQWEEAVVAWGGDLVPGFHVSGAGEWTSWRGVAMPGWRSAHRRLTSAR